MSGFHESVNIKAAAHYIYANSILSSAQSDLIKERMPTGLFAAGVVSVAVENRPNQDGGSAGYHCQAEVCHQSFGSYV